MFRKDRDENIKGGGVLLYTKCSLRAVSAQTNNMTGEHVCCRLFTGTHNEITIAVCYRSNNKQRLNVDTDQQVIDLINHLHQRNFLLMGDFNYPDIDWESNTTGSSISERFLNCVEDNFLTQHVREPTRGNACLDLIITSDPDIVEQVEALIRTVGK